MRRKISLFLLAVLPFVASADDYHVFVWYYLSGSTTMHSYEVDCSGSIDAAFNIASDMVPVRIRERDFDFRLQSPGKVCVSNKITGATYSLENNPVISRQMNQLKAIQYFAVQNSLTFDRLLMNFKTYYNGSFYFFSEFNIAQYVQAFFSSLNYSQIQQVLQILGDLNSIKTDVSSLVPLVESNKNINASIASTVAGLNGITNQFESLLNNRLFDYTVNYDIPQIVNYLSDFREVDPNLPTGDNNMLMAYYYSLKGFNFQNGLVDQIVLANKMVDDGFASSYSDAINKLQSNSFRSSILGPAISAERQKRDVIAKLKAAGMTSPPSGGSFDNMNLGELETLYEYSYNTPTSTNATLQTKALDALKKINESTTDALGTLSDIRNEVTGPREVEVLNWPDDITGLSVSLSNAFAEAFANLDLNVSSEVWQVGRDYEEYRNHTAGVNPSYNSFFSDASFLAISGPNDGKWWTESQNLLAYIAFYTASNRSLAAGILSELATNNELVASSIAAASNNLAAIWGNNPRGWLDDKLDQLQEGQTKLIRGFNSLTYFQGVENIIDTYYRDVTQLPTEISFNTPFPAQFGIDLRSMQGFLELLHAATMIFLIGGWLICVPYIARWMFEHVNKMFDLFKK